MPTPPNELTNTVPGQGLPQQVSPDRGPQFDGKIEGLEMQDGGLVEQGRQGQARPRQGQAVESSVEPTAPDSPRDEGRQEP